MLFRGPTFKGSQLFTRRSSQPSVLAGVASPRSNTIKLTLEQVKSMEKAGYTRDEAETLLPIMEEIIVSNTASQLDVIIDAIKVTNQEPVGYILYPVYLDQKLFKVVTR